MSKFRDEYLESSGEFDTESRETTGTLGKKDRSGGTGKATRRRKSRTGSKYSTSVHASLIKRRAARNKSWQKVSWTVKPRPRRATMARVPGTSRSLRELHTRDRDPRACFGASFALFPLSASPTVSFPFGLSLARAVKLCWTV